MNLSVVHIGKRWWPLIIPPEGPGEPDPAQKKTFFFFLTHLFLAYVGIVQNRKSKSHVK